MGNGPWWMYTAIPSRRIDDLFYQFYPCSGRRLLNKRFQFPEAINPVPGMHCCLDPGVFAWHLFDDYTGTLRYCFRY